MEIVAKQCAGVVVVAQKRRAGKADLDGATVGLTEVRKKTSLRVVTAVNLIEKINALDVDIVVLGAHDVGIILKFLDVDDGDLRLAGMVVHYLSGLDVASEGLSAVDGVDNEPATGEFELRLNEQIDAINDEVELWNDAPTLEVVGEKAGVVVRQRGLAAALRVPNDAVPYACIKFLLNRLGREELGIAHDVLLQSVSLVDIGERILQNEGQTIMAEQRRADAVGRRVG